VTGGEEWIGDLITNLLHLATHRGYNIERILRRARRDYAAEGGDERLDEPYPAHLDALFVGKVREQLYKAFAWHNARTLGDVVALTKRELLATPELSEPALTALVGGLDRLGLELDPD
jgi:hypothetical protein